VGVARQIASGVAGMIYRPGDDIAEEYHKWYYGTLTQLQTSWLGVTCWKSVSDMWNYQEILTELRPSLVVEFGTRFGGSALYFATVLRSLGHPFRVFSVDVSHKDVPDAVRRDENIELMECSSVLPAVASRVAELRQDFPGRVFTILDSDHSMAHVLAEMKLLRPLLMSGDYLVVEDSNVNGHPVLPGFGPGPFEAIEAYEAQYPSDYIHDRVRETKFGFTFATNGFLIRDS
jgi:cephalosporin hydroxylase